MSKHCTTEGTFPHGGMIVTGHTMMVVTLLTFITTFHNLITNITLNFFRHFRTTIITWYKRFQNLKTSIFYTPVIFLTDFLLD